MSDCLDTQTLQYHTEGATRDAICRLLHVGPNRVSRVLGFFRDEQRWYSVLWKREFSVLATST
jgi:hypothetical protein